MAKFTGSTSPSPDNVNVFAFGTRVRVDAGAPFPDEAVVGVAPFRNLQGKPLYVGTAVSGDKATPCQVRRHVFVVAVAYFSRLTPRRCRKAGVR